MKRIFLPFNNLYQPEAIYFNITIKPLQLSLSATQAPVPKEALYPVQLAPDSKHP